MKGNYEWEYFYDPAYYFMFAVRPKTDKKFCSPYLFHTNLLEDGS